MAGEKCRQGELFPQDEQERVRTGHKRLLSMAQCREAARRYAAGESSPDIAKDYGVDRNVVLRAVKLVAPEIELRRGRGGRGKGRVKPLLCSVCKTMRPTEQFWWRYRHEECRVCRACLNARKREREEVEAAGSKVCMDCREKKPLSEFTVHSVTGRPASYCRPCANERGRGHAKRLRDSATHFRCNLCKREKSKEDFPWGGNGVGLERRCKECMAARYAMGARSDKHKYSDARSIAKQHGREFTLTIEEYTALRHGPCHYCGHHLSEWGVGLDRKDCALGYVSGNVVPCCFPCNQAKSDIFTYEEMLVLGEAVRRIRAARAEHGPPVPLAGKVGQKRKYQRD